MKTYANYEKKTELVINYNLFLYFSFPSGLAINALTIEPVFEPLDTLLECLNLTQNESHQGFYNKYE